MIPAREQESIRRSEATRIAGEAVLTLIEQNPKLFEDFLMAEDMKNMETSAPAAPPAAPPVGPPRPPIPGDKPPVMPPFPGPTGPGGPPPPQPPIGAMPQEDPRRRR